MSLESKYKIEVIVSADESNRHKPYCWGLFHFSGEWCNEGGGWAETPHKAWDEAFDFYVKFKRQRF